MMSRGSACPSCGGEQRHRQRVCRACGYNRADAKPRQESLLRRLVQAEPVTAYAVGFIDPSRSRPVVHGVDVIGAHDRPVLTGFQFTIHSRSAATWDEAHRAVLSDLRTPALRWAYDLIPRSEPERRYVRADRQ